MSETNFTKGPWLVKDGVVVCTNPYDVNTRVAYAYSGHSIPYTSEILSNAHLIASAPEMYEMLMVASREVCFLVDEVNRLRMKQVHCQTETPPDMVDAETSYLIDKLLAKARGES